jgi:predicted Zn-dependent protease with MMP-like domain
VSDLRPPRRRRRLAPGERPERTHRHRFDRLVQRAIRSLPPRFAERLENVAIVVADEPSPAQRQAARIGADDDLYGLYEGVPQPQRSATYGLALPDKITLFQRAIEADCRNEHEIARQVRHTLIHELAHHFGIDDARLDELGFD